jgi:hypothetical protein
MSPATARSRQILVERTLDHVRHALALCDELSATLPACHLQHALDLLDPLAAPADGAPPRPN